MVIIKFLAHFTAYLLALLFGLLFTFSLVGLVMKIYHLLRTREWVQYSGDDDIIRQDSLVWSRNRAKILRDIGVRIGLVVLIGLIFALLFQAVHWTA